MIPYRLLPALALLLSLAACGDSAPRSGAGIGGEVIEQGLARCVVESPYRNVGEGLDAPGRLEMDVAVGTQPEGGCRDNRDFQIGTGLYDVTGVVANTGGAGWEDPLQVFGGLHTRQYARAYVFRTPCNGKRLMFVSADIGLMVGSLRSGVLDRIAADPELSPHYGPENLMLSATHTHSGPAGYSHYEAPNALHFGYDATVYEAIVQGLYQSIRLAHANLIAHPATLSPKLAIGELLNANINRSKPAFAMNAEDERRQFLNQRGEEVQVNKRVVQLNLRRDDGTAIGLINWFGVHPTTVGQATTLVSSDNKGYAAVGFEKLMRTDYRVAPGTDTFVAAFAQADEGDSSPNLFIEQYLPPDPRRGGGKDDYESNAINGTKQLAKALELHDQGKALSGPVDYRFFHVAMNDVEVTDPVVLASLRHPPELDSADKRTCNGALGVSFAAGAEDGPGYTSEGINCAASPELIENAVADVQAVLDGKIPGHLLSAALVCHVDALPLLGLGCQAEKPVLIPLHLLDTPLSALEQLIAFGALNLDLNLLDLEPKVLPVQLFRIGNLAILGLPWEVTTMSARRLRKTVLDELAPVGVDTVVVAGLVNDFVHYLTTREEYASQQYEGGSNIFGPWTLAAVQQESRRLALAMRNDAPSPAGPAYIRGVPVLRRPPYVPADSPLPQSAFGAVIQDVPASAAPGDTVRASFRAGHPRNDLRTQASYVYAERQDARGDWQVVAEDRDPELLFVWAPAIPALLPLDLVPTLSSTAEAVWTIPKNTPPGIYRLRHAGSSWASPLTTPVPYDGVSSPFTIAGPVGNCPN